MTRRPYDYWTDCDRASIPHSCRIEQVAVAKGFGAVASRLHRQGQVMGRGTARLLVRFDGLCRVRHKPSYAGCRIMPSVGVEVLVSGG